MTIAVKKKLNPEYFCRDFKMKKMLMINNRSTIDSVKEDFNVAYPFLKIEFFKQAHIRGKGSHKKNMYPHNEKINSIRRNLAAGKITLSDNLTVNELENIFENKFGLHAQVFRKSGNVWLETSSTDDWTLKQQNEEGKSLADHISAEKEDPADHDMY